MGKNVAAPSVFDGRPQIPFPALAVFEPIEQHHVMSPGQFCSKLQNLGVRPGLGEGTHVEVTTPNVQNRTLGTVAQTCCHRKYGSVAKIRLRSRKCEDGVCEQVHSG